MYIHDGVDHRIRAHMLVRQLVDEHDPRYGMGSMTCSIYDTAWVAMITKQTGEEKRWLFPSAFDFLLSSQQNDGGWHTSPISSFQLDGILHTLAALLALCKHIAAPHLISARTRDDLQHRQSRAIYFLEAKFSEWDVSATIPDGFEILLSKLMQLLAADGIEFSFPGLQRLNELKAKTEAHFNDSKLYGSVRSVAARNLEGLIGEIDFDRVKQHRISGSIMASPASTAAYLMHSSTWDDEAEAYLAHVLSVGDERSVGAVPSQYPTTVFEVTQSLSVLLSNGFDAEELGDSHLENVGDFLEACLAIDGGVTGSAPYVESNADDTAKSISTLSQLGRIPNPHGLLVRFETPDFFKTFTEERNPSFRTNCLVLKALVDLLPGNREQTLQIEKTVIFVTNSWWTTNGQIEDQSNTSLNYPTMLMVDALVRLVDLWDAGFAPVLNNLSLRDRVFICLYQALTRTMQSQNTNGSWGRAPCCEPTAYAVLILSKLALLSSAPRVKSQLSQAIEKARKFLVDNFRPFADPEHVWRGKTTAGSSVLFQAYVLAALQAPVANSLNGHSVESRFEMSLAKITIQTKYYARQSWFANVPEWQIQACLVESNLFLPRLRDVRFSIFPRDHLKDDQYFETIPFTWLATSSLKRRYTGPEYLYQMMILSLLNRQLDDYVTHFIGEIFAGCLVEAEDILHEIFDEVQRYSAKDRCYCDSHTTGISNSAASANPNASIADARTVLHRFISQILNHPYVLMASHHDQAQLRSELLAFLLGRINQFPDQSSESASTPRSSESESASDQTHHAYTFAFFCCLVGNQSLKGSDTQRCDFLDTPEQQYLTAALCRHLSIINFMSNTAPEQPIERVQLQSAPLKPRMSRFSLGRHHSRSVSSASSASSKYSDGDVSPVSAVSSHSSAPSISTLSQNSPNPAKQPGYRSQGQISSQSLQLTRLLSHERRCLNVCLQSLDAAGINQRVANVLAHFVDHSELSESMFRDPNIGSCYKPTTAGEVIEQAYMQDKPPTPPRKAAARKTSVAAIHTPVSVEPLSMSRDNSTQGTSSSDEKRFMLSRADVGLKGKSSTEHEWNWNRPIPRHSTGRSSRSSIEMSRIERIMTEMGDSSFRISPEPTINPIAHSQTRPRAATEGESMYALPLRPSRTGAHKRIASACSGEADLVKLAKAQAQTQKKLYRESLRKARAERKAREAEAAETRRRRASSLQTMAIAEATRLMSLKGPTPKRDSTLQEMNVEYDIAKEKGWVKAPPPERTVGVTEESQSRKLLRASRLGGPRLKLPF